MYKNPPYKILLKKGIQYLLQYWRIFFVNWYKPKFNVPTTKTLNSKLLFIIVKKGTSNFNCRHRCANCTEPTMCYFEYISRTFMIEYAHALSPTCSIHNWTKWTTVHSCFYRIQMELKWSDNNNIILKARHIYLSCSVVRSTTRYTSIGLMSVFFLCISPILVILIKNLVMYLLCIMPREFWKIYNSIHLLLTSLLTWWFIWLVSWICFIPSSFSFDKGNS